MRLSSAVEVINGLLNSTNVTCYAAPGPYSFFHVRAVYTPVDIEDAIPISGIAVNELKNFINKKFSLAIIEHMY